MKKLNLDQEEREILDAHQKSRHAAVANDPLATVKLGLQALNIAVGEVADSGSGHARLLGVSRSVSRP